MNEEKTNATENPEEAATSSDAVDLDTLAEIVDNLGKAENNESASNGDEKAQAVVDLQARIDQIESQNTKLHKLVDKMVRMYLTMGRTAGVLSRSSL